MFKIVKRRDLNPTVIAMDIEAPLIANKAKAGQFIILRVDDEGERIPLTVAGCNKKEGTVEIIFQIVGASTFLLSKKQVGDYISDFVGPLGEPSEVEGFESVCVIGGGAGCAIALPVARGLHEHGVKVTSIVGFRNKDLVILEDEFKQVSDHYILMSDDGSVGTKGLVTNALEELLTKGEKFDRVICIGPLIMMKFVCLLTKKYNLKTIVSMNPIMIDGTGMCGCCRLTVNGKTKFACVDGPDFDGHEVDFDEAIKRNRMYHEFEKKKYDEACNLFKKEVR